MAERIQSPCVRNCCLDEQDVCLGCYRTLAEILIWGEADDETRRQILAKAEEREQQARLKKES